MDEIAQHDQVYFLTVPVLSTYQNIKCNGIEFMSFFSTGGVSILTLYIEVVPLAFLSFVRRGLLVFEWAYCIKSNDMI